MPHSSQHYLPKYQILKIRNSLEDRQSRLAKPTVNEVSGRKRHLKSKTKSCQPRRKNTEVEKALQESAWKPLKSLINQPKNY